MIITEQLANLLVMKVIFHDVPTQTKGGEERKTTLSEVETKIDNHRKALLKKKLVQALSSRGAYPIDFDGNKSATVGNQIKAMTVRNGDAEFVKCSQILAQELFSKQTGATSSGLLCVIDARVEGQRCIVLMKLERHEGAQLTMSENDGKKTFSMQVLDDLVLTEGTRLFKAALFLRGSADNLTGIACDSQLGASANNQMALFWLNFLGCKFIVDPRVATQRFFDATLTFVSQSVTDPTVKGQIYDSLQSEYKSAKLTFSPRKFIEEYIPNGYQPLIREYFEDEGVALSQFHKDTSDIERRLRFLRYETKSGTIISVPIADAELVVINDKGITINDVLAKVK